MAEKRKPVMYPGSDKIKAARQHGKPMPWVTAVQTELVRRGFKTLEVTKSWNLQTKQAIKAFQKKKGLTADGIPGPATWTALFGKDSVPFVGSGNKDYPYVWFRPGVNVPPNKDFMKKLNAVGKIGYEKHGKRLVMVSGYRPCGSPNDAVGASTQWGLWKLYQAGRGNLAARPCTSNHGSGNAADTGWEDKNGGNYVSFLNVGGWARQVAKDHNLCFPVPGEAWHVQPGSGPWRI